MKNQIHYKLHRGGPNLKLNVKLDISNGDWFTADFHFHGKSPEYSAHLEEFEQRLRDSVGEGEKLKDLTPLEIHEFFGKVIHALAEDHQSLGEKVGDWTI